MAKSVHLEFKWQGLGTYVVNSPVNSPAAKTPVPIRMREKKPRSPHFIAVAGGVSINISLSHPKPLTRFKYMPVESHCSQMFLLHLGYFRPS